MKNIQQLLAERLIDENHPTLESARCINSKQRRRPCTVCVEVCPHGVFETGRSPRWDLCENCDLCTVSCPARAIRPALIHLRRVLEVCQSAPPRLKIVCRQQNAQGELTLPCIASIPWEAIAYLALEGEVVFLQDCDGCAQKDVCLPVWQASLVRVEEFLGPARYARAVTVTADKTPLPPPAISRREIFSLLRERLKSAASAVIPVEETDSIDGLLYRRLLAKRLKMRQANGIEESFGWRTKTFSGACWGCGICARVCPSKAIETVTEDGAPHMAHSPWNCSGCGICEAVCLGGGGDGFRTEQVTDPLRPVLTQVTHPPCTNCGGPLRPGTGELCMDCVPKKRR